MKTYLKLQFSSEGEVPSKIAKLLENLGWKPIVGDRDFVMIWDSGEGFGGVYLNKLDELHRTLKGTNVRYTLYSSK
jgi:hypothetical protein